MSDETINVMQRASEREIELAILKASNELTDMAAHPNWNAMWTLLNAFASGETQNQFSRVEPIAVLAEVYAMMAPVDQLRRKALAKMGIPI